MDRIVPGLEQEAFEAVAEAIDARSLSVEGRAVLRFWAARRMREIPAAVFHRSQRGARELRPSFRVAIAHAADDIVEGKTPA